MIPEFHFTFGATKPKVSKTKKKQVKNNKPKTTRNKIINKDVEGVIILASSLRGGINPNFDAIVTIGNREIIVPIADNGYDCHNVKIVYRHLNGEFIQHIRCSDDVSMGLPPCYTPIKPNSKVKGNVIEISDKLFFKIKKILK